MSHNVTVRTLRPHDTTKGMKQPGDQYSRTMTEADQLAKLGEVDIVPAAPAKGRKSK